MDYGLIGMAAAIGLAGAGSALGTGSAGMAAIGAMKKCYAAGKQAPFLLIAFVGAPLTQTIYGIILMNAIAGSVLDDGLRFGAGLFGGLAMGASAWFQGKSGAAASDSLAETGKGAAQYFIILGIVETIALFAMVFLMINL